MPTKLHLAAGWVATMFCLIGVASTGDAADRGTKPGHSAKEQADPPPALDINIDAALKEFEGQAPAAGSSPAGKALEWDPEAYNRVDQGRDAKLNSDRGGPNGSWADKPSGEDLKRGYSGAPPKKPFITFTPNLGSDR